MAATESPRANGAGAGTAMPHLPPISVAKFKRGMLLLEELVAENRQAFIEHGQAYKEVHREKTSRKLTAEEGASIAAGFPDDPRSPEDLAAAFVKHRTLRAYDEPPPIEVLVAAGSGVVTALLRSGQLMTVLIEMDDDTFERTVEDGTLDQRLDEGASVLDREPMIRARERAAAALEHLAEAAGADSGKGLSLIVRSVWQALSQAMTTLIPAPSISSSLIDSQRPTDGTGEPSSTGPPTETPSS